MELQQKHLTKLAPNPPKYFVDCEALRGEVVMLIIPTALFLDYF